MVITELKKFDLAYVSSFNLRYLHVCNPPVGAMLEIRHYD